MATRSYSPLRVPDLLSEDKDRHIRKLKTALVPLKQQLQELPLLQQKLLYIEDRRTALLNQTTMLEGEYRLKQESALRAQEIMKEDIELLTIQSRDFALQLSDLSADNEALNIQLQKINTEFGDHKQLAVNLTQKRRELEIETNRLRALQKGLAEQNLRLIRNSESLCDENDQISRKTADLKGISLEMLTQKKIFIEKLHQFQNDNNSLDAKVCGNEDIHESVISTLKKQESLLNLQQQKSIQLQIRIDKLSSDHSHIASNLRLQQEVTSDLINQIRNAEKTLQDYKLRVIKSNQQRVDTSGENDGVMKVNFQLRKDWDACEEHLQNLIQQNIILDQQLKKFIQQDDFILKLIMQRRARPMTSGYMLKSSRVTGL